MLELFKRILKENSTVRETEEMARQVKGEVQQKEPRSKLHKLWVPELDEMAKSLETKRGLNKVAMYQSRTQARISIIIKGDVDVTGPKIKEVYDILSRDDTN